MCNCNTFNASSAMSKKWLAAILVSVLSSGFAHALPEAMRQPKMNQTTNTLDLAQNYQDDLSIQIQRLEARKAALERQRMSGGESFTTSTGSQFAVPSFNSPVDQELTEVNNMLFQLKAQQQNGR